ncbi:hypothetical protein N7541_007043 [Penicillium brevicompactum]|uniref:Tetrapyrrole biosynthesis uroporphyrinogen III synthase domain-containing protein n=1 Tax=Penicillium brevicompactum TaxID=5074 RepID=A0A9W9UNW5_PENBR|nr:hypothetical protein N7541_007043 [Penicillium brevicompactum]
MPSPILLLKTKSSPQDGYEEFFTANNYDPIFVPVLEHRFHKQNLATVQELFNTGAFTSTPQNAKKYGGLIFTSQRAVEGFASMIENADVFNVPSDPLVLYTVGPATARTLTTLRDKHLPHATIHGAEAGTGANLAQLMLEHYNGLYAGPEKPGLLFLVGEVRRDIIPKTLMDESLGERKIGVEEMVVYETGVMESFEGDFGGWMSRRHEGLVWVVVFSPTGCEAMLRVLGLGPFASGAKSSEKVFIATIGPTTRDHLRDEFGFEAHVCAEKPSPEGVLEGIKQFMS